MTGKQFKLLRKNLGFTSRSLAERFGCSERTIRNFQNRNEVGGIVVLAMEQLRIEENNKKVY